AYMGKILRVNLSDKSIKKEIFPKDLAQKYLGGRGLASKILFDEVDPKVDALSPENKLIFATGPLTLTNAPTGGRYMVITKGPLTGGIASSNSGGFFGAKFKATGYDMIIFEGKAEKPIYLFIDDERVELHDASHVWGKDVNDTTDILISESGHKSANVACIGPAGENLSYFAAIINEKTRAAGRTGVGAVMGSKNLKAVVVASGKFKTPIEHPEEFKAAVKENLNAIKENGVTGEGLPKLGTKVLDNIINSIGAYPTHNFQFSQFEHTDEVSGEALVEKGYLVKNVACYACPIACGRKVTLPDGSKGEGPEYESGWAYGASCGVSDLTAITRAGFMCNNLGFDTISAGATVATAMELYEKGFITKEELGKGPELKFGSSEAILYYTKLMAYREGIGDKMANGAYRLAESYGHPELAMAVKKQELPAYDPRVVQGQGLAYATNNRGGDHTRAYLISPEVIGLPEKLDSQQNEGKAAWVKIFQELTAIIDSAGLCIFSSFAMGAPEYLTLIKNATGFDWTEAEMMKVGERIWNLEREFNLRAGIDPKQDTLPDRLLKDKITSGPGKGNINRLDTMLPEYYQLRGWNEKGIPTKEKLHELEIV
ncbi:MAG: aldehyde ferredoxin oxidoreductase family protein, partial [Bacteroidales bacterium]|nr:aldehyde ferredoxin oxidoreductase family protein [Bacteroidales bacterium]